MARIWTPRAAKASSWARPRPPAAICSAGTLFSSSASTTRRPRWPVAPLMTIVMMIPYMRENTAIHATRASSGLLPRPFLQWTGLGRADPGIPVRRPAALERAAPPGGRHQRKNAGPNPQTLEKDGFISRAAQPVIPPRVDYSLTGRGIELAALLNPRVAWIADRAKARPALSGPASTGS